MLAKLERHLGRDTPIVKCCDLEFRKVESLAQGVQAVFKRKTIEQRRLQLERLARQERLIGRATREYFQSAGIGPDMHVIDVGSGTRAVAFLAAELVGPSGQVEGTDLARPQVPPRPRGQQHSVSDRCLSQLIFQLELNRAECEFLTGVMPMGSSFFGPVTAEAETRREMPSSGGGE